MNLLTVSEVNHNMAAEKNQPAEQVIHMKGVSVRYRVPSERIRSIKENAIRLMRRKIQMRTFWALNDVGLDVYPGETFGLVEVNGAGKSTMLKVIARVLRPTKGRVIVRGKVAPLLELGAGFHLELTGRENIFLYGALLGFTNREMKEKFDQIIEFSELGEFINAPIRTYSSGMYARLGFSVATAREPDVLIVDEVLSVGDEAFQKKCMDRIENFRKNGAAIILVSHNMTTIQAMYQRVAWLDHGVLKAIGEPDRVIQSYRDRRG